MATDPRSLEPAAAGAGGGTIIDHTLDGAVTQVKARGYWEQVWIRFRRDRVAVASIFFIIFLILIAFPGAYIAEKLLGHGPNTLFFDGVDDRLIPVGPWSYVTNPDTGEKDLLILGADGSLGRDEFLRLLYGARVSLEVAMLSTFGAMTLGVLLGAIAGYYRGWIDTTVSRVIEITMVHALDARAHFDGLALADMAAGDRLILKRSADVVRFVHPPGYRYFATLRGKLGWGESIEKRRATD